MKAKEFIDLIDSTLGESWSDDGDKLAKVLDEYATLKIKEIQETIIHLFNYPEDISIDHCNHCWSESLYGDKLCHVCKYSLGGATTKK